MSMLYVAGAGAPLANEPQDGSPTRDPYFAFTSSAVSSFSLHTRSPTLSPARIRTGPGYQIGIGLGYRTQGTRIEGSLIYGRFDADSIRFAEGRGSLSGYFDLRGATVEVFHELRAGARLRPYLGAGLGVVRFRANDVTLAGFPPTVGANTLLSYQFMAGVSYTTNPWRFSLGYRYVGMGEQDFETGGESLRADPLRIDSIQAGVQLAF